MIEKNDISAVIETYDKNRISIGTLGSHSALNIFKGAKEEGFRTVCILNKNREIVYRKFPLVDEMIFVESFSDLIDEKVQDKLRSLNTILVPHNGSACAHVWEQAASTLGNKQGDAEKMVARSKLDLA